MGETLSQCHLPYTHVELFVDFCDQKFVSISVIRSLYRSLGIEVCIDLCDQNFVLISVIRD